MAELIVYCDHGLGLHGLDRRADYNAEGQSPGEYDEPRYLLPMLALGVPRWRWRRAAQGGAGDRSRAWRS